MPPGAPPDAVLPVAELPLVCTDELADDELADDVPPAGDDAVPLLRVTGVEGRGCDCAVFATRVAVPLAVWVGAGTDGADTFEGTDGAETFGAVGAGAGAAGAFGTIEGAVTFGTETVGIVAGAFTVVTVSVGSDPATAVPSPLAKANPAPPSTIAQMPAAVLTLP